MLNVNRIVHVSISRCCQCLLTHVSLMGVNKFVDAFSSTHFVSCFNIYNEGRIVQSHYTGTISGLTVKFWDPSSNI